jgi:ABC-type transport system involved in cytochrome c biogenesis permease subunit
MNEIEKYVKPYDNNFTTMVPTNFVIKMRTCKIWQLIRFIIINIKMLIVVRKSH